MNRQQIEMATWEKENQENIIKWEADWTIKAGIKIVTFYLKDGTQKVFELNAPLPINLYGGE